MPAIIYEWDARRVRYRDATAGGRVVGRDVTVTLVERMIAAEAVRLRALADRLRQGRMTVADWQWAVRDELKALHALAAATARGGRAQMTPRQWGRVGALTRGEYRYLNGFARAVTNPTYALGPNFLRRAESYAWAARTTFWQTDRELMKDAGVRYAARIPHARERCPECLAWSYDVAGWVEIDKLPAIGSLACLTNCKCSFTYKETAEMLRAA